MHGGGFNRIVDVSVANNKHPTLHQYVLRVPRFEAAQLDREVAPLRLLRQQSSIQVLNVVAFDTTRHNVLESPYMIQTRIPSSSLFPGYPDMPHETKCAVAKELGNVYRELLSIRSVTAGKLTLSPYQGSLMIQPFDDTGLDAIVPYENGPATKATLEMLRTTIGHKREIAKEEGANQSVRVSFFDQFIAMASEMAARGVLDESYYSLCHLDLEPRNILVRFPTPTQPQVIIGIPDWDSALFGPRLMSCSPPMWLWAWNDEDEEDERLANNTPPTPELRKLKQVFEDAAGPTYRRYAYGSQYRLARKLIRFAIDGLHSNEGLKGAASLLDEWNKVNATSMLDSTRLLGQYSPSAPIP